MRATQTINQLYATLDKRQRQLEALRRVSLQINRSLDLEWIMQQAVEAVCDVLGVEAAAISVVDPERDELVIRAQRGMIAFAHEPVYLPRGVGLAWETLLNRETIIIDSWEDEPRLAMPSFLDEHIRSTILVPMVINGEPIGVLSAMTRISHAFTPDEQSMLAGIADQVAAALLNARLHEQTRRQTQELEKVTRLLKEQEMQRTHIFDDLARALRNPVTFIQSYPELLLDGGLGPINEAQNQALTSLQQHAQLLANLVHNLSAMKIADPEKLRYQQVAVAALLRKAAETAQVAADKKNINLTVNADVHLPAVWLDPQQVSRVIEKLLNNAVRFTLPNGIIHLTARMDDTATIRVTITDAGPEIPQQERAQFFKRLYHGKLERTYPGIGVELVLAQRIVESHGGTLGIESAEGGGNTFYFVLPVQNVKRKA